MIILQKVSYLILCVLLFVFSGIQNEFKENFKEKKGNFEVADSVEVINTLGNFHEAIKKADVVSAGNILSSTAKILESGDIENKTKYLSHHFYSDGKFSKAMTREIKSQSVTFQGEVAWVATSSRLRGEFNYRKLDLNSLELALLKKNGNKWEIVALHWSSTPR